MSSVSGVTRGSGWAKGCRVPAYTRFAPHLKASSTSALPMPRLAPLTRTALSAIFTVFLPQVDATEAIAVAVAKTADDLDDCPCCHEPDAFISVRGGGLR